MDKITKQDYGVLIAIGSLGLAGVLVAVWPHLINAELNLPWQRHATLAYVLLLLAAFITCLNIRTAWIRPLLYYLRNRSFENFEGHSCISAVVGMLLIPCAFLAPSSTTLGIVILLVGLINPGGMHWAFLSMIQMWREARGIRTQS